MKFLLRSFKSRFRLPYLPCRAAPDRGYVAKTNSAMEYKEDDQFERGRCLECGDVLPYGRSDMKFCCDGCRSRYHYVNGGHLKSLRTKTIRALDRNHEILESLLERGVTSMNIPDLAQAGYRFDCVTSYHKVRNHNEYRCFDIKYYMSENRIFDLSRVSTPARRTPRPCRDP